MKRDAKPSSLASPAREPLRRQGRLRVGFVDFWRGFDPARNFFTRLLDDCVEWELSEQPELLFCSCFGQEHRRHDCKKVFYTGENWLPNPWAYDYFFTFLPGGLRERNFRLPVWVVDSGYDWDEARLLRRAPGRPHGERRFCNFLYGNARARCRQRFFHLLNSRRGVDSAGRVLRNTDLVVGPSHAEKLAFLGAYRFTIAFENCSYPHYLTEKLLQPFLAGSVPIYWGDPLVAAEFNPEAFINCHNHRDFDSVVERVLSLDDDPKAWERMAGAPLFRSAQVPDYARREVVLEQLRWVLAGGRRVAPGAATRCKDFLFRLAHRGLYIRRIDWVSRIMIALASRACKGCEVST